MPDLAYIEDKEESDNPLLNKDHQSSSWPLKARPSLCAFYQDDGLIGSLSDEHSKKVAAFAFEIFEKWLKRRSAYVYRLKNTTSGEDEQNGYYVDDLVYQECAFLLIEAMIFASKADLRIDQDEHDSMYRVYKAIFAHDDVRGIIDLLLTAPINLEDLVLRVKYREEAIDIYELSALILQGAHFLNAGYLEELAALLHLEPSLKRILDTEVLKKEEA